MTTNRPPAAAATADTAHETFQGRAALRPLRVTRTAMFTRSTPTATAPVQEELSGMRHEGVVPKRHESPAQPDAQAYKQAGNAVCVGAVQAVFRLVPDHGVPRTNTAGALGCLEVRPSPLRLVPPQT